MNFWLPTRQQTGVGFVVPVLNRVTGRSRKQASALRTAGAAGPGRREAMLTRVRGLRRVVIFLLLPQTGDTQQKSVSLKLPRQCLARHCWYRLWGHWLMKKPRGWGGGH